MRHEFTCERVHNAEVIKTPMAVRYDDSYPDSLPILTIYTKPNKAGEFKIEDAYEVEEIPCQGDFHGRGFRLTKTVTAKDGQYAPATQEEPYDVFIDADQGRHTCDCKAGVFAKYCKHQDALRYLIESKLLDRTTQAESLVVDHQPEYPDDLPESDPFAGIALSPHEDFFADVPF